MGNLQLQKSEMTCVLNKLNELHLCLKTHDLSFLHVLRRELSSLIREMEEDQQVLVYYWLLEMKAEVYERTGLVPIDESNVTSILLDYYHAFYQARIEVYQGETRQARKCYMTAAAFLDNIPDPIEKALFHHEVAGFYEKLREPLLVVHHAHLAKKYYNRAFGYEKESLKCQKIHDRNAAKMA